MILSPETVDFLIRAVRRDEGCEPVLASQALLELCRLRDTHPSADAALFTRNIRYIIELWRLDEAMGSGRPEARVVVCQARQEWFSQHSFPAGS